MKNQRILNFLILESLFCVFLVIGLIYGSRLTSVHPRIINVDLKAIRLGADFWVVIVRNTLAFITLSTVIFLGKSISYIFFGINGLNVGIVWSQLTFLQGSILLLPHGVVEFGAYFLLVDAILFSTDKLQLLKKIFISYLILCIAAGIEVSVTPMLAARLLEGK
ncbi:stage II sporulation protein M [Lactiplantibacillus pentosus]|uniref:stage II sporulation protein M n=1 Tax=Lactiplantibacillus pentosus TaxID=1589 RepID=UPI001B36BBBC|nr:stage II sporulation protein M [Lactiplantibacillus pentosus]MBQ0835497.1 stage II sporulation protein M [Lactiplantibacillus pentosus]